MQGIKLNSMVKFKLIYTVVRLWLLHQDFNSRNNFCNGFNTSSLVLKQLLFAGVVRFLKIKIL